ncbi:hypothetical protein OENI_60096 [Oenococcus oeni]|nr:hypothetical protein OENI_300009 [Oenococcus oeni]SYW03199.1 hypothetical protein OENI_60096 [Oenococcus oeni]SYW18751.1 hypothetical protein OENI_50098 [Oenococcus oeni]
MRVFIAENQTMLKTALTGILNLEDDIEVIDRPKMAEQP